MEIKTDISHTILRFFFQAEDGIRDLTVTGVQTCALPILSGRAEKAGFILADLKLEFGFDKQENIVLADSIGPDEFRLWPKADYSPGRTQESYDKQPIRDWLGKVGYKKTLDEARREGRPTPRPPDLPSDLIQETSRRYIIAYERLTGLKL